MLHFGDLNWLTVFVAAVINMVIGALWYSVIFVKPWMKAAGINPETIDKEKRKGMGASYALMFALTFVLAYFLGRITTPGVSIGEIVKWDLFLWLGIVVTTHAGDYIFLRRGLKLFLINTTQYLVIIIVDTILFSVWH